MAIDADQPSKVRIVLNWQAIWWRDRFGYQTGLSTNKNGARDWYLPPNERSWQSDQCPHSCGAGNVASEWTHRVYLALGGSDGGGSRRRCGDHLRLDQTALADWSGLWPNGFSALTHIA